MSTLTERSRADELLRSAQESAYRFPVGFAGFTAALRTDADGPEVRVTVRGPRDVSIDPSDEAVVEADPTLRWAKGELAGIVGHRWPRDYADGDGRWAKRVDPDAASPAGELVVFEDDPFTSSYRVLDGQLTEVHRAPGGNPFTIVIGARARLGDTYVPTAFSVYHWSADDTGRRQALTKVDMYVDEFAEVEVEGAAKSVWLPALRRVTTGDANGLTTRQLLLTDHRVVEA